MSLTIDIDMTEANMDHPTTGRRRRHKSLPTLHAPVALHHLDTENGPSDEEGEKEAKRKIRADYSYLYSQQSPPYEYDQVMGITQVGSGEAEGFEEGLDLEYHDAAEDPNVLEPEGHTWESVLSHGGCGSSSLRECIELLNNTERKAPATCHSGPKMENRSGPPQFWGFVGDFRVLLVLAGFVGDFGVVERCKNRFGSFVGDLGVLQVTLSFVRGVLGGQTP